MHDIKHGKIPMLTAFIVLKTFIFDIVDEGKAE
jgi:hypothetical protein